MPIVFAQSLFKKIEKVKSINTPKTPFLSTMSIGES